MTRPAWRKKHDDAYRHPAPNPATLKLAYTVCPHMKRKLSYVTRRVALQAAAKFRAVDGKDHRPYLCLKCFDWHLTTQPQNGSRK